MDSSPHYNGRISNNFVHVVVDTGIYLCRAEGTKVFNNTVFIDSDYPNAIEYRYDTHGSRIINNLTNRKITARNGGVAELNRNIETAKASWFNNSSSGNLHLNGYISNVVDQGLIIPEFKHDIDGTARSGSFDIGADEWTD